MKHNYFILSLILIVLYIGCGKKETGKDAPPSWTTNETGIYPATMTAVVQAPPALIKTSVPSDKLAAFIEGECRGVGERIELDSAAVFFVLIKGKSSENGLIQFKYYSGKNSYLYQTSYFLNFVMDGNFGTVDEPMILQLKR